MSFLLICGNDFPSFTTPKLIHFNHILVKNLKKIVTKIQKLRERGLKEIIFKQMYKPGNHFMMCALSSMILDVTGQL